MNAQTGKPEAQPEQDRPQVTVTRFSQVVGSESFPGVLRRTLLWGQRLMVLYNTFAVGSRVPLHAHPQEQITHVIEGALEIEVGDTVYTLGVGDSMLIPSNVRHDTRALSRTLVLDIFSPPREELKN